MHVLFGDPTHNKKNERESQSGSGWSILGRNMAPDKVLNARGTDAAVVARACTPGVRTQ